MVSLHSGSLCTERDFYEKWLWLTTCYDACCFYVLCTKRQKGFKRNFIILLIELCENSWTQNSGVPLLIKSKCVHDNQTNPCNSSNLVHLVRNVRMKGSERKPGSLDLSVHIIIAGSQDYFRFALTVWYTLFTTWRSREAFIDIYLYCLLSSICPGSIISSRWMSEKYRLTIKIQPLVTFINKKSVSSQLICPHWQTMLLLVPTLR